jgi:hypothetical protein
MKGIDPKASLLFQIRGAGLPPPEVECTFHPERKWRFDYCWKATKTAIEYDGIYGKNTASHLSRSGVSRDQEKINEAQLLGWVVIRVNAATVENGKAIEWLEKAMWRNR